MKQYYIEYNQLILKVKKSPVVVRIILYIVTFLFIFLPIIGFLSAMNDGSELKFGMFISIGVFGLISFYMLRVSLWNTFGHEIITFETDRITYKADYCWFTDRIKEYEINKPLFEIIQIGYESDSIGVLLIHNDENYIQTVTKIPIKELENLIDEIKNKF